MAVLSTLKHHGSYDRTCLIYDNLCLYITQSTRSGFVRGFTKMAEAEGSWKKGFQKRCVSSLLPFSLD